MTTSPLRQADGHARALEVLRKVPRVTESGMVNPRRAPGETPGETAEESLLSRSDTRRARRELEETLARLAKDLAAIRLQWLQKLELPEDVFDAVTSARAIQTASAQNRQLRLVRAALRDTDWSLIRARVDALHKHGTLPLKLSPTTSGGQERASSPAARAPAWVARLLGEGAPAIEALLEVAPNGDRTHLRTLVRQVQKASAGRRAKAQARLTDAVAGLLFNTGVC